MKRSIEWKVAANRMTGWRRHDIKQCVSLVRAVIPELPHSSQWLEGDPVTPENAGTIPPGTAIATFEDGRYSNAATGNHAAIFLGPHYDAVGLRVGIDVVDQSERFQARERAFLFATTGRGYRAGEFSVIRR